MAEQNWTTNKELSALVDELDELIQKFATIGENGFALTLQAMLIARVVDGDDSTASVKLFEEPAKRVLAAAMQ